MVQDNLCGTVLGNKYELLEVIGRGGMGLVYRARHNMMNRIVAIKVLNKAHITDSASLKRFQIEAQAASALSMAHILTVFDFGVAIDGQPYMVMDLLQGPSLDKVLETEGRLSTERAVKICIQVCEALAHAHAKGIIHRDIKPSNIILVQNEEQPDFVKIVDFGIAKLLNPTDPDLAGLTRTGEVFGSPLYMSPEQWHAQKLDARTDIYSLGAVMYRSLCGRFMFDKCDVVQLMYKHISQMPQPFANFGVAVPESIEAIVFKALEKLPDNRFQSMSQMSQALRDAYANLGKESSERDLFVSSETATRLVVQIEAPPVKAQPIIPDAFTPAPAIALNQPAAGAAAETKQPVDRKRKIIISVLSVWCVGVVAFAAVVISGHKAPAPDQAEISGTIPAPAGSQIHTPPVQAVVAPKPPDTVAEPAESVPPQSPPAAHLKSASLKPPRPQTVSASAAEPVHERPVATTSRPEPKAAKPSKKARITSGIKQAFKHLLRKL
jgi:serine/threonine-protein kinase